MKKNAGSKQRTQEILRKRNGFGWIEKRGNIYQNINEYD